MMESPWKNRKLFRRLLCAAGCVLACLWIGGCALFQSYPERISAAQSAFTDGDYKEAARILENQKPPARDKLLFLLELGTYYHTMGDYQASNEKFLQAVSMMKEYDERAAIAVRDGASFAGAVIVNDTMQPYRGTHHERVLAHTYLAMNYLLMKDLENARVEILQAYAKQKEAREEHERSIRETREEVKENGLDANGITDMVNAAFGGDRDVLKKAGNVYQNLFTYYVSCLVYELGREYDDAYIDVHTIDSQHPNVPVIQRDLMRLARKSGRLNEYKRRLRMFACEEHKTGEGWGEIVLLYACGEGPVMDQIKFPIPVPSKDKDGNPITTTVTVAIPKFVRQRNVVTKAWLYVDGERVGRTHALMDVDATAIRSLWDRAPAIAMRQITRAAGRYAAIRYTQEKGGNLIGTIVSLISFALEQADRRSWISLPQNFQVGRASVRAGKHRLEFRLTGHGKEGQVTLADVEVRDCGITIIGLRSTGIRGTARHITF